MVAHLTTNESGGQVYTDISGRKFNYRLIERPETKKLVVHFSAFFGDWGDKKEFKQNYQGYFHRFRMLKDEPFASMLFLCDEYGLTKNGTYYLGEHGDLFVERAMIEIIRKVASQLGVHYSNIIMIGSSMGACAALKFGIEFNCKAIISICPHIDLDICAEKQGRFEHVKFVLKDGNPYSQDNFPVTRRIRDLVHNRTIEGRKLPMLFMHSCKDDHGVHVEQVLPLVEAWHKAKSVVFFDERPYGGHGSDFCTKAMIVDLLRSLFEAKPIHVSKYRRERFLPPNERFYYRVSRKLKSGVKRPIKLILKNLGLWQA